MYFYTGTSTKLVSSRRYSDHMLHMFLMPRSQHLNSRIIVLGLMIVKCRMLTLFDLKKQRCCGIQLYCSASITSSVSLSKYAFKNPCSDIRGSKCIRCDDAINCDHVEQEGTRGSDHQNPCIKSTPKPAADVAQVQTPSKVNVLANLCRHSNIEHVTDASQHQSITINVEDGFVCRSVILNICNLVNMCANRCPLLTRDTFGGLSISSTTTKVQPNCAIGERDSLCFIMSSISTEHVKFPRIE